MTYQDWPKVDMTCATCAAGNYATLHAHKPHTPEGQSTPVSTPSGPSAEGCTCWPENDGHDGDCGIWGKPRLEGQDATQETQDATEAAQERVERYAEALWRGCRVIEGEAAAKAAIAVADQEQAEKDATIAELRDQRAEWLRTARDWSARAGAAEARVAELEATVAEVRELHAPKGAGDDWWCEECTVMSPCETAAILDAPKDTTAP